MVLIFLLATAFCVYTYAIFPLMLHWLVRCQAVCGETANPEPCTSEGLSMTAAPERGAGRRGIDLAAISNLTPSVSVVIAAHNEEKNLHSKIAALSTLTYPQEALQCLFVSDGSTDRTLEILQQACANNQNWQVLHYPEAAGKPTALNLGVSKAQGDFIVFMDARQSVSPGCIEALLARFADASIGAVSGELVLADDKGAEATNVGLYWRYEKWIRMNESRLHSTTGATGALYAIRRADYQPLAKDTLLDDFDTPVSLLRLGKRTVFENTAKAFDQVEASTDAEFRRKARTLAGNFQSFARHTWLFNPAQNPVWWQFLSHKVFRLLVPYALVIALLASLLGDGPLLRVMLWTQVVFYGLGIAGFLGVNSRLTTVIKVFLQLNAAAMVGAWRAIRGSGAVKWKTS